MQMVRLGVRVCEFRVHFGLADRFPQVADEFIVLIDTSRDFDDFHEVRRVSSGREAFDGGLGNTEMSEAVRRAMG